MRARCRPVRRLLFLCGAVLAANVAAAPPPARLPSTESSIGVWYAPGAPASGKLWRDGDPGERLFIRGRVITTSGKPIAGVLVEIWQADGTGVVHPDRYRAALRTPRNGEFRIDTALPGYIWGPRHIHLMVTHPGHPRFITRVFFKRDPEVAVSGRPELAIALEDATRDGEALLLGRIELVLRSN